jgi:hypothetical protein
MDTYTTILYMAIFALCCISFLCGLPPNCLALQHWSPVRTLCLYYDYRKQFINNDNICVHFAAERQCVKSSDKDFQRLMTAVLAATHEVRTRMEHRMATKIKWDTCNVQDLLHSVRSAMAQGSNFVPLEYPGKFQPGIDGTNDRGLPVISVCCAKVDGERVLCVRGHLLPHDVEIHGGSREHLTACRKANGCVVLKLNIRIVEAARHSYL